MEIKQEQQQETCLIETKRKTPPPVTFPLLKKVKEESIPQNETEEMEMKTDSEIKDAISRIKNSLKSFGSKLRDGGEKLKASLRKYEDELERRNKIKPAVLPVNVPVSAPAEPESLLLSSPAPPPEPQRFPDTHSVDSVQQMISNGDKKDGASNISSPDRSLAANKPLSLSESQHGVATSVPTADANKHDSGTDEMIGNILDEVVTVATESVGRNFSASGNDDRPPVTFLKGSRGVFVQQNQEQDIELKTDSEIKETIARLKRNMEAFGHKLHDKGEKIKESIRRYEHELQRRNKIIPQVNPTSQLLLRPVSPQECPRSPVTHLVDSVKQMVPTPLTPDWSHLLPPSTGDDGRPLENSYESVDLELVMKSDRQLNETLASFKNNLKLCPKLRDGGQKLKENIKRYEDELERRLKGQSMQKIIPGVLPVNIPVSAQVNPTSQLLLRPVSPQECPRSPVTHLVDSVKQMVPTPLTPDWNHLLPPSTGNDGRPLENSYETVDLELVMKSDRQLNETLAGFKNNLKLCPKLPDGGQKLKENIKRYEDELERRLKGQSMQKIIPGVLPVNIPVSAQVNPTSQLLLRPVSPQECPRSPVTHLVDSVKQMVPTPLTPDWNQLLPPSTGDDGRPLENSYESVDLKLVMKSDRQLNETLASFKNNLKLCPKLPDGGQKLKENIKRYEDELERRLKGQSMQKTRPGVSPVNIPVSAQVNPTSQLLSKPASPQECPLSQVTHLVDNVKQMVPNDCNKDGDSNLPSREHVAGNKASPFSGSQYGVAANGLTANADKHDSLTDEKMLKIVRELVTVGIAQTEVGKAAEVCYKDPVKAKVLFALPDHLRKSYVRGFLYPRK